MLFHCILRWQRVLKYAVQVRRVNKDIVEAYMDFPLNCKPRKWGKSVQPQLLTGRQPFPSGLLNWAFPWRFVENIANFRGKMPPVPNIVTKHVHSESFTCV